MLPFRVFLLFMYKLRQFFNVSHFPTCLTPRDIFVFHVRSCILPWLSSAVLASLSMSSWSAVPSSRVSYYSSSSNEQTTWVVVYVFSSILVQLSVVVSPLRFLLSLLVIPFILRKYVISAAWILLLMSFVNIQLSQPYVRIGQKIASHTFTSSFL